MKKFLLIITLLTGLSAHAQTVLQLDRYTSGKYIGKSRIPLFEPFKRCNYKLVIAEDHIEIDAPKPAVFTVIRLLGEERSAGIIYKTREVQDKNGSLYGLRIIETGQHLYFELIDSRNQTSKLFKSKINLGI